MAVYVLDERQEIVPVGVTGELYLSGVGLARGYLKRAGQTAERFVPHPYSRTAGARLYRTGDVVRWRNNGTLEYLGRGDQQVKVRGYRIELGEIEAALNSYEGVREAVVVARDEAGSGEGKRLVCYCVRKEGAAVTAAELRAKVRARLPEYMVPAAVVFVAALPLTPNGKVDRKALPAPDGSASDSRKNFIAPRNVLELQVTKAFEELLHVQNVGIRDNFFELGGHSLLAVRVMARLQHLTGKSLPLATLIHKSTVEALAAEFGKEVEAGVRSSLVPIQSKGSKLPFFCVHPSGGHVLCFTDLSRHLGDEQPFYGLQAQGLSGQERPLLRVEEMATRYIDEILTVQPEGPYLLGGWSMGSVVAFEMTRQLQVRGKQVAFLALLDGRARTADSAPVEHNEEMLLINFAQDMGISLDGLELSPEQVAELQLDERLIKILEEAKKADLIPPEVELADVRNLFKVFKANVGAMYNYTPEPLDVRVTLLRASEHFRIEGEQDRRMGWGAVALGGVEVHDVPGNHFNIVREPYVKSLAEKLFEGLEEAQNAELAYSFNLG
jgi:thioesterase domain-containing protein